MAVNHKSCWDPVVIAMTSPRQLAFMSKSELFKNKLFGKFLKSLGAFPVHRGKGDIAAVKTSLTILKNEKMMLIFPEGKRVKQNEKVDVKPGVTMLATHAKVPVIPACISGGYRWMSKVTITYGEPVYFDEYYDQKLSVAKLQELSTSLMDKIYSMEEKK